MVYTSVLKDFIACVDMIYVIIARTYHNFNQGGVATCSGKDGVVWVLVH